MKTDLIIFVNNYFDSANNVLAYASSCDLDDTTLRPLIGGINVNKYFIT